jgi:hypothetical protein
MGVVDGEAFIIQFDHANDPTSQALGSPSLRQRRRDEDVGHCGLAEVWFCGAEPSHLGSGKGMVGSKQGRSKCPQPAKDNGDNHSQTLSEPSFVSKR